MNSINFFGLKLSIIQLDLLKREIYYAIKTNKKKVIFGYSLGSIRILKKYPIMLYFGWEKADIMIVDGRGLYLLGKILGFPFKDDISIPQLSNIILDMANQHSFSVKLLGATKENNIKAVENIQRKYKNIRVLNGINGFFKEEEEQEIVNEINKHKPDILFVGISSPKKEEFINRWKDKLDVKIILLCGGVIDILAGDKIQTPLWLKKIGGASFFRFIQEPKRLYKYFFPFIFFLIFSFLPAIIINVIIKRRKDFSIPNFYKIPNY